MPGRLACTSLCTATVQNPHQKFATTQASNRTTARATHTHPSLRIPSTSRIGDAPLSLCDINSTRFRLLHFRDTSPCSHDRKSPRQRQYEWAPNPLPPPLTTAPESKPPTMLSYILIQNRQGKTRLAKWYAPFSDEEKIKLKGEVHRLVAPRDQKYQSNFVEFRNHKIVYRRYAGLFFCVCVDTNDNELAYLEAIHFFVEVLDAFFGNVSELDLVFNFYKVYAILDEVFLAGEIEETSKQAVLTRLEHLDKLE
ncbi:hypothetical protein NLG97_g7541 [Lecanicillium saksenae]|nr:hypothetical protein NLG97_g7541 [Lecanicillium saksenae]